VDARSTHGIVGALRASKPPSGVPAASNAETEYLIQDPHHEYAARFIEHLYRTFGYRAVCFYTDRRERLFHQPDYPVLRSQCVAASYDVSARDLSRFSAHVASAHSIAAVVPFNEPTVAPAVELARLLGLGWAQPDVMRRFHDKFALKDYIRSNHPEVRMNASQRAESVAQVLAARRDPAYRRFVLKPNNGFGNRSIGLFDETTDARVLEAFLGRLQGTPVVMEQFIDGNEYFINGQVDDRGEVCIVAIFEYVRVAANGRHNIDSETLLLPHRDPRFAGLAAYAQQVVRATELRRSPFHLELKVSDQGPCLIEVGARLAGHRNALLCEELHGPQLDLFALAAHYYLKADDFGPIPLDWDAYDANAVRYVHGVAERDGRIYQLEGVREVESLPEFHKWVKRPVVGTHMQPTRDLLTMPFSLILRGATQEQLALAATKVRQILHINRSVGPVRRAFVSASSQGRRYARAARIRLAALSAAPEGVIEPISSNLSVRALARNTRRLVRRSTARVTRKLQLLEIGISPRTSAAAPDSPERNEAVVQWARQYLGRPHPKLGRSGPICPFVRPTIDLDQFVVKHYDKVDGTNIQVLRQVVLQESRSFRNMFPRAAPNGMLASVVLVFPNISAAHFLALDYLHDELKTHLIVKHELMSSPFHPRSVKPSVSNPEFPVFRAPFPMLAIRHIDVRDIAFIGTNQRAFKRYHALFSKLFERGEVSNEFGHVSGYTQACERFGFPSN
jgi:carbamoylphosphate synthase large subunit